MKKAFDDVFIDCTSLGTKLKTDEYAAYGQYAIVDQGQHDIAGYTDRPEGVFTDVPAIVFGDHTRAIKFIDQPFFLGADGVKLLKAKDEPANYKYLYYALKSIRIPNTGYNRHFKWLKEARIEYPGAATQQSVVDVLSKVERTIASRQQQLATLDALIKARFVEMFGDVEANWMGWKKEPLRQHIDMITGCPFDSSAYVEKGIRICGGLIILPDRIKWDECKYWSSIDGYEQFLLASNDIVVALDRPWITGGFKIGTISEADLPALLIQRTARIRGVDMAQSFVYYLLKDNSFERHCTVTGSLVPHISNKDIYSYQVILPPIELQNQFATFVSQVDKSKVAVQKALDEAQVLFDSLMQKYFG